MTCIHSVDSVTDADIMIMLINNALEKHLATKTGLLPTQKERENLNTHINTTTRNKERLLSVKECFKNDHEGYLSLYVDPIIINNKLHTYHSRDTILQSIPRKKITMAFSKIAQGKSFQSVAKEMNLYFFYDTLHISKLSDEEQKNVELYHPYLPSLLSLSAGELFKNIIENSVQYFVVSVVKKTDSMCITANLGIDKESFDEWYKNMCKDITINIHNDELRNTIQQHYPSVWWLKHLHPKTQ